MSLHHSNEFSSMLGWNYCSIHLFRLFLLIVALFWLFSSLDVQETHNWNRSTADDTGAVCCIFRLLGPRDGRHQSPGGLTAPLSLGKLAISLHNVLQWSWVESAMAQDRYRAAAACLVPGIVMKHTLKTDHMDTWFRCEKGCHKRIVHIHERDVSMFNNITTQNLKTTF